MKKILTLVLLSMMYVSAQAITVYIRPTADVTPYIWAWNTDSENNITGGEWPGWSMSWVKKADTHNLYSCTFTDSKVTFMISNNGSDTGKTEPCPITADVYYDWDTSTGTLTPIEDTSITGVSLQGSFDSWESGSNFSKVSDKVFTLDLDVSTLNDFDFKLVPTNGSVTSWLGSNDNVTIDAPDGWISDDGTNNHNFKLHHNVSHYNTYRLTATWGGDKFVCDGWTLKVEGLEARTYSIVGMETTDQGAGWSRDWDMEPTANANEFKVVKEFEIPAAGTYQYKLRTNHAWGIYELPGDHNATYGFNDAGKFRLTFTANIETWTVNLVAERIVEIGESGLATFSSNHVLDFGNVESAVAGKVLKAYAVNELTSTAAKLTEVTGVPNENGVLLKGDEGKYYVPFGSAESLGVTNYLQSAHNGHEVVNDGDAYVLFTDGLFHPANAGNIPAGRAYLNKSDLVTAGVISGARLALIFDDDPTAVESVKTVTVQDNVYYNLAGQRIAQPAKGLYIVNGKKVVLK